MIGPFCVFRCDAGPRIGIGHVARCRALADELRPRGWRCAFAVSAETVATMPSLKTSGYPIVVLPPDFPAAGEPAHLSAAQPEGCVLLIVDHYGRGVQFERACRSWAKHILVIDDLADRKHDCDWLLDPTLGREPDDYRPLVPGGATLLLGPDYALLRPAFAQVRPEALARRRADPGLRRVLVSFGGTDPHDATGACLDALVRLRPSFALDVVLGAAAPHLEAVRKRIGQMPNTALHVETAQMYELMSRADCALGGAGATSWERCCVGLPTIVSILADNQRSIAKALAEAGAIRLVGDWRTAAAGQMVESLASLTIDDLAGLSTRAAVICDGSGIFRTANALEPLRQGYV